MTAFPNPNSGAGLKKLDEHLFTRYYITGHKASKDDITIYAAFSNPPPSRYVNVSRWYNHIEALLSISGISSQGSGVSIDGLAYITKHADDVMVVDDDNDQDVDLIGGKEEKKPAKERTVSLTASTKKKISWESTVMVIIPNDSETDMKELEENIRSIQMEGLIWGASKLVPAGYGINVLRIIATLPFDEEIDVFEGIINTYIFSFGHFSIETAVLYEYLILIKPNDEEADMKKLEETVRSIKVSGLFWGASKLVPVDYGIKLLGIECTTVGCLGNMIGFPTVVKEKITEHRYVHSCQTLSLNRICNGITEEESNSKDDSADDDDVDLFGEERAGSLKAYSKKYFGRSGLHLYQLVGDKPDIKKAEESVRSRQIEGVVWGASKVVKVGYGLKYLRTVYTIVDDHLCLKTVSQKIRGIPLNRICKHPKSIYKLLEAL